MQSYNVLQLEEDVKCPLLVHMFGDDHGCAVIHEATVSSMVTVRSSQRKICGPKQGDFEGGLDPPPTHTHTLILASGTSPLRSSTPRTSGPGVS